MTIQDDIEEELLIASKLIRQELMIPLEYYDKIIVELTAAKAEIEKLKQVIKSDYWLRRAGALEKEVNRLHAMSLK